MHHGSVFEGEFKDGDASGYGVLKCTDGKEYKGNWFHDKFLCTDENLTRDEWNTGKFNGKAKTMSLHGNIYEG